MTETDILSEMFKTRPIDMQPMWLAMFQAPKTMSTASSTPWRWSRH